jgi:hypothetical protein
MHSVVDILGSSQGLITMAIAAVVGIGSPFMDRLVIRRKRVQYQVLYNSKIGLTPDSFEPADKNHSEKAHPELRGLVEQLDKLSVMMFRGSQRGQFGHRGRRHQPAADGDLRLARGVGRAGVGGQ